MNSIPVIHCISNIVTANDCANILLAAGYSPTMAEEPREMADIAEAADACVINLGTPSERKYEAARAAGLAYNRLGKPLVIDPVGVSVSGYRRERLRALLTEVHPDVIRCNLNEALALLRMTAEDGSGIEPRDRIALGERPGGKQPAGVISGNGNAAAGEIGALGDGVCGMESDALQSCGIDSRESAELGGQMAPDIAKRLAAALRCTVLISGAADAVSDGQTVRLISGGSDKIKQVTGSGCMLSALVGGFCAAAETAAFQKSAIGSNVSENSGNDAKSGVNNVTVVPGIPAPVDAAVRSGIFDAVCRASSYYKECAAYADAHTSYYGGTGELRMRLIDAAYQLRADGWVFRK